MPSECSTIVAAIAGATVGLLPGVIALALRHRDRQQAYLHIAIRVETSTRRFLSVLTEVENRGPKPKKLQHAFLIVGPEHENVLLTAKKLGYAARSTNVLATMDTLLRVERRQERRDGEGRYMKSLPYYYCENVRVSDEKLTYRAPIPIHSQYAREPHSVRLFVGGENRLHRSVHDSFILP